MTDHNTASASRRDYLRAVGGVATVSTVGLAGCMGEESPGATGLLSTVVTDQPGDIADFESCVVTIDGIWVKPASEDNEDSEDNETDEGVQEQEEGDIDTGDSREYYAFEEPRAADLVTLQDGQTHLLDKDRELPVGTYEFLQLDISGIRAVLAESGEEATVDTPGSAPLQFTLAFEIRENDRTVFTGDFTPVKRGPTDQYLLQPVATNTGVSYEETETDGNETDQ